MKLYDRLGRQCWPWWPVYWYARLRKLPWAEDSHPRYLQWSDYEVSRGELAFVPETMECYDCGWEARNNGKPHEEDNSGFPFITRKIVALGPMVEERRDPTQTYKMDCGHTGI